MSDAGSFDGAGVGSGVTVSAQVDVAALLEAYVAVLEASDREIRPETELPYERDMIKQALLQGIEAAEEDERDLLEAAFMALAWFQKLSAREAEAIEAFEAGGDDEEAPAALEDEAALAESGGVYADVLMRIERDSRALRRELREHGYGE